MYINGALNINAGAGGAIITGSCPGGAGIETNVSQNITTTGNVTFTGSSTAGAYIDGLSLGGVFTATSGTLTFDGTSGPGGCYGIEQGVSGSWAAGITTYGYVVFKGTGHNGAGHNGDLNLGAMQGNGTVTLIGRNEGLPNDGTFTAIGGLPYNVVLQTINGASINGQLGPGTDTTGGGNYTVSSAGSVSLNGRTINAGGGTISLTSASGYSVIGNTTLQAAALVITDTNAFTLSSGVTLALNTSATIANAINGSGGNLSVSGGPITLTGANGYSGSTAISSGTLTIGGASVLGGGNYAANIVDNGALVLSSSSNQTFGGAITGNGSLAKLGGSLLLLAASNSYSGPTTIGGGTLQLGTGLSGQDGSISGTSGVSTSGALVYNIAGPAVQQVRYNINGAGSLTKTGSGTVVLNGFANNGYGGGTIVNAGAARGGQQHLAGHGRTGRQRRHAGPRRDHRRQYHCDQPQRRSAASSPISITTRCRPMQPLPSISPATQPSAARSTTPAGYTISLTKAGNGTLTLNGASTISGGASVQNSGTLRIGPAGSLSMPTAGVTVNNTSALVVDGALTANAVAVFHDTYPNGATLGGSGTITVGSGNLDYYSYASSTFGGQIAGVGQVWLLNGQLALTGSSSYTGGTFVQGGVLAAGAANALSPNSDVLVSGGTLDVSRYAQSIKSLALSGGVLDLGISGSYPAALTTTITNSASTLAFSGGTINVLTISSPTTVQGLYKLVSGYGATTGTFTQGTVPTNYHLSATATELDLVHFATVFMTPATAINAANVHTGPSTVGVQLNNGAPSGSDSAYYQLSTSVASSLSGSGTVAAQSAVQLSGSYTATAGANTLSVSCANVGSYGWTNGVPSAVTITQTGYRLAAATISPTVNMGTIHVGDSFGTQPLTVTNSVTNADAFSEKLDAAFGTPTGAASNNGGSISLLAPQASNSTAMSVGLGGGAEHRRGGQRHGAGEPDQRRQRQQQPGHDQLGHADAERQRRRVFGQRGMDGRFGRLGLPGQQQQLDRRQRQRRAGRAGHVPRLYQRRYGDLRRDGSRRHGEP